MIPEAEERLLVRHPKRYAGEAFPPIRGVLIVWQEAWVVMARWEGQRQSFQLSYDDIAALRKTAEMPAHGWVRRLLEEG